jgi:hypothetical protein
MNKTTTRIPAEFRPETRFELRPNAATPFRIAQETEFERLKSRLLAEQLARNAAQELNAPLQRAANEAAALAWISFHPLLMFPVLFEEKIRVALRQAERQARIYADSRELAVV